ncbi:acyltransferase [Legionella sp. PC997]|uniref:acyltransferase family protein n=1 Tax=Legionella sp. PC997 TaxID=2755562 RepID=UPI0015F9C4B4|nr:acyltransferase [Legionella sp. PC997]QMT59722.1 hypothetical protein HBNCFIEN_01089 [Legionella sp. PC997]
MLKISKGIDVRFLIVWAQNLKKLVPKFASNIFFKKLFPSKSYVPSTGPWVGTHLKHTPELDGIRGYACLSVLVLHCLTGIISNSNPWVTLFRQHTFQLLLSGVDLFFVLSGFLIGGILLDTKNKPHFFKIFWIKRVTRIFPVAFDARILCSSNFYNGSFSYYAFQ